MKLKTIAFDLVVAKFDCDFSEQNLLCYAEVMVIILGPINKII